MPTQALKARVQARDRLLVQAESVSQMLQAEVLEAFARGELAQAQAAASAHDLELRALTENLRIYQAELHAQADELASSQAQAEAEAQRFARLFGSMPVAALRVAFNGEVLEHNAMASRLLRLRARGARARFLHRVVDSADYQAQVRPAFHEARASGDSALEGVRFVAEDGSTFVGDLHIAHLPASAGGLDSDGSFACALIDRSEQRRHLQTIEATAAALRHSEALLADSARLARIGGWALTLRPRELHWSEQLRGILELPADAPATLETLLGLCAPHHRKALAGAVAAAELGTAFELEVDMHSARGRAMRVLAVGHADLEGAAVVRVSGVLQDISSQHLVRRELGDLSERLAMANDAGGIGIWDWDLGAALVCDARMRQLLRLADDAAAPPSLAAALLPQLQEADAATLHAALTGTLERGEPLNLELPLAPLAGDADGHGAPRGPRWLHLTGRAHADVHGRATRLIGCAWDSSPEHEALQLLAAKEAAERADRAKSEFLSRMSHELRTPLNAILGFSQLMRMEAEAGDLVLKPHRVTLIESAARHLLDLVNEVLDVSRIESGQLDLRLVALDLRRVVAESLPMVLGLAERSGVHLIDTTAEAAPCTVLGDALRLKEVLINLLSNAVKYNHQGGHVEVTLEDTGEHAVLRVADTGCGLSTQQLQGLFQPFNRLGAEASGIEGSGMGLFVSRRFVELMGGRIEVSSEPGRGTTVAVHLNRPALAA